MRQWCKSLPLKSVWALLFFMPFAAQWKNNDFLDLLQTGWQKITQKVSDFTL
jgi:hypothetical protein